MHPTKITTLMALLAIGAPAMGRAVDAPIPNRASPTAPRGAVTKPVKLIFARDDSSALDARAPRTVFTPIKGPVNLPILGRDDPSALEARAPQFLKPIKGPGNIKLLVLGRDDSLLLEAGSSPKLFNPHEPPQQGSLWPRR
ncbi:hypothetical protein GGTG_06510 [Gaeumannomyces tritici R3-111a-1]|uniref:Uncharacterized protein n=1 Tax=Gaeumannomyces tritici (strain R3-111a-1) TaxID=644352 RepID=J3NZ10_GAET3|nr:hypothetical protein GGTG_06510 [Gaeumannomyces tritici R3-111a-1]EJT76593.1 hypothetical protein GGTG_06510 [Gaeumannomyces tritici R3-111a-1]